MHVRDHALAHAFRLYQGSGAVEPLDLYIHVAIQHNDTHCSLNCGN